MCDYVKEILAKDPAAGNELLRLNMPHIAKELGITMNNPERIGTKEKQNGQLSLSKSPVPRPQL